MKESNRLDWKTDSFKPPHKTECLCMVKYNIFYFLTYHAERDEWFCEDTDEWLTPEYWISLKDLRNTIDD